MRRRLAAALTSATVLGPLTAAEEGPAATRARSVLDAQVEAWNRGDLEGSSGE